MRLLLLIVMIALLPLRGWAANSMALDHAGQQIATVNIAASARITGDTGHFDTEKSHGHAGCHELATAASDTSHDDADTHKATHACAGCDTCGLCHLSVAAVFSTPAPDQFHPAALPAAPGSHFASVTAPPGLKPPIG